MPAQQTTGRVNLLMLYEMACSLNTRIGKKFKINSKMMRNALFSKQLQAQRVEPCWKILRCFQWNDVHRAVSRVGPASGFCERSHEVDSMVRTMVTQIKCYQDSNHKITRLDKPAGELYNSHTRIAAFQCGYVIFCFLSWMGGGFAN